MTSSQSTMVVGLYHVRPDKRDAWLEVWQHLAAVAKSRPECHTFKLDCDPADRTQCRVISTWSTDHAFDGFVREVGLPWIERYLDYSESPPSFAHFPLLNRDAEDSVKTLSAHA